MKVLIIGKNGFIGRNLYEYYSMSGSDVTALASAELNLLHEAEVRSYLKKTYFDVVIDAAIYNPRVGLNKDSSKEFEYDVRMFHNLAKYNKYYGKLIYFGSGAEYNKLYPICSVKEADLKNDIPDNAYGMAKYIIGQEIEAGIYDSDNIYNLRVFGLYGKYENWKSTFISGACCKVIKDMPITIRRNVIFDYLYIDDFCRMIDRFICMDKHGFHTYNITSGKRISILQIAESVMRISGKNTGIMVKNSGYANEYTANSDRLFKEIGWNETEPMELSVKKLYDYYVQNKDMIDKELLDE